MYYLDMVSLLWLHMYNLLQDEKSLLSIKSVDETEYVFKKNPHRIPELLKLKNEVWNIYQELTKKH